MKPTVSLLAWLLASEGALAHPGHDMPALHWHATDTFGFVLVVALAALALWIGRDR